MDAFAKSELDDLVQQAEALYARGELDAALQLLSQVVTAEPTHVRALNDLGTICYSRSAVDSAAQFYNRALDLSPHSLVYLTNFVTVLLDMGQMACARGLLASGLALHPNADSLKQLQQELEQRCVMAEEPPAAEMIFRVLNTGEPIPTASVA